MAFKNYYVGYQNKGFEFYSKAELLEFLNKPEVREEALQDNVTIVKENDASRIFYYLSYKGLEVDYKEKMVDGAYGN